MESFFALLQKNVLNRRSWTTREDLRIAIVTWIDRTQRAASSREPRGSGLSFCLQTGSARMPGSFRTFSPGRGKEERSRFASTVLRPSALISLGLPRG